MKKPFHESSYLAQVRRLRNLARQALGQYPIQVQSIDFINHGENTTFRVQAATGQNYLLRIHRDQYHTKSAIIEELAWLDHLAKKGLSVPKPVLSIKRNRVETVHVPDVGSRNCSVLEWLDGRFLEKSIKPSHMFQVGQLIADLQNNNPQGPVKSRHYWSADGLVGAHPKFGSIDRLSAISKREQNSLIKARRSVLKKLKQFEKKFPKKLGLIHADLHFGNIVLVNKKIAAIDFDDCGYGFFAYDLVIPFLSVQNYLGKKSKHMIPDYKNALLDGYRSKRKWDQYDDEIFSYLVTARKLLMLGWLNSRSDNPKLKKYLVGAVKNTLAHLKRVT